MDYQKPGVGACVALRKFNRTGNLNGGEWKAFFSKVLVLIRQKEVAFWSDKRECAHIHVLRRPMVVLFMANLVQSMNILTVHSFGFLGGMGKGGGGQMNSCHCQNLILSVI